jgi:hypothetical protein
MLLKRDNRSGVGGPNLLRTILGMLREASDILWWLYLKYDASAGKVADGYSRRDCQGGRKLGELVKGVFHAA